MATSLAAKIEIARSIGLAALALLFFYYFGFPLYWKISATIRDKLHNNPTVTQGLSEIVMETRKTVGWYADDSRVHATNRKLLGYQVLSRVVG